MCAVSFHVSWFSSSPMRLKCVITSWRKKRCMDSSIENILENLLSAGYKLHFYVENHLYLRLVFFSRSSSLRSVDFSDFSFCNFLLMRSLIFSLLSESYSSSASPSDSSSVCWENVEFYDLWQQWHKLPKSPSLHFALLTSAPSPDFFFFFLLKQNYEYLLEQGKTTRWRTKCLKHTCSQLEQSSV